MGILGSDPPQVSVHGKTIFTEANTVPLQILGFGYRGFKIDFGDFDPVRIVTEFCTVYLTAFDRVIHFSYQKNTGASRPKKVKKRQTFKTP